MLLFSSKEVIATFFSLRNIYSFLLTVVLDVRGAQSYLLRVRMYSMLENPSRSHRQIPVTCEVQNNLEKLVQNSVLKCRYYLNRSSYLITD